MIEVSGFHYWSDELSKPDVKEIPLDQIRLDGGSQPRVEIDLEAVSEYKEAIEKGVNLPRLDVFYDGADNWLADGFHRWHGGKAAGVEFLECNVHVGTQREAVLFSVGANATHGLKRSAADKRKAVTTLLNDPEWCKWSSRRIAEQCNVSQGLVEDVRSKLEEEESSLRKCAVTNEETGDSGESGEKTRTYINRHGTESQMKTGGINAKRSKSKEGKAEAGNPVSETAAGAASDPEADRRAAIMGAQRVTGTPSGGTKFDPTEFDGAMTDDAQESKPSKVPKHLEEVASSCQEFAGCVQEAGRLKSRIEKLTAGAGGGKIAKYWSDIDRCIEQVKVYLKCYRFWAPCPECKITDKHTKAAKDCKLCGGHGWIAETNGLSDIHKGWLRERGVKV